VAAPVFKNIINRIINMGGSPVNQMIASAPSASVALVTIPDVKNMSIPDAAAKLRTAGLIPTIVGGPTVVVKQFPLAGAKINPGAHLTLYTNSFTLARGDSVAVPDITGKPLRVAVQDLVQANLKVKVTGSGIVRSQDPQPGSLVACGTMCEIACGNR
jgi:beta-lactam-binding protein with PASTA domain